VNLQVLAVDAPPDAAQVVARLVPAERILHAAADLVDAVKRQRDDGRGQRRDPLEVRGEHERDAEHEEKQQDVEHVQVLVRNRRRDDALRGL
jgi:hypothetical protein